jgi:Domain of unknown function (DUF4349)/Putative zinc-finger
MRKSDHPIEQEELMAYLDGELATERAAAAAVHLEGCRECQSLAADLQSVSRRMMAWEVEEPDLQIMPALAAALAARGRAVPLSSRFWRPLLRVRPWVWGLAGACVVALVIVSSPRLTRHSQYVDMVRANKAVSAEIAPGLTVNVVSAVPLAVARKPMIARTAQLAFTTTEFDKVRDRIEEILKRHQGYVGQLSASAPVGVARALEATLRVPADQLDAAVTELKKLGRVESESQSGEEVTEQYIDLEARLSNARNTEQRLTDLLRQRTGKLADVLAVEKEIDSVRGEIERMEAEKKNLASRVDFATLNVKVTEDYQAQLQVVPGSTLARFRNAAVEGYQSMVEALVSVLLFLFTFGPSLLIWSAILFFPARGAWRRFRRELAR